MRGLLIGRSQMPPADAGSEGLDHGGCGWI